MNFIKKTLCLLLALLMAFSLAGCIKLPNLPKLGLPTQTPAEPAPKNTAALPQTQGKGKAPSSAPVGDEGGAQAQLDALDKEIFYDLVSGDGLTYHLSIAHPENFPEIKDVELGIGEFSFEANSAYTKKEREWLDRLYAIDKEGLSYDGKITYDTLLQYLELSTAYEDKYYYYAEPLDTYVGDHSNLPLNMVFYDMHSKADVEGYLILLEDISNYMAELLTFEQEKSAQGKFMPDSALDEVLEQIQAVIDDRKSFFLLATFDEFIADIGELSDEERSAYSQKNAQLVDKMIDAYQLLYDGLNKLRGTATNEKGLCEYGEEGKAYFELGLKDAACSDITVKDALKTLEKQQNTFLQTIQTAIAEEPSVVDLFDTVNINIGTTQENIDYLENLMTGYYPPLSEHSITFIDCPAVLEDQFSPAAYLLPPVDDASENIIILNARTLDSSNNYASTIAHEGYPGHLYHYQYIRGILDKTGYTRQRLSLTGYFESWSQSAEVFFAQNNDRFSNAYCRLMFANDGITNLTLPAICSIYVNYYGYDAAKLEKYVANFFGDDAADMAEIYYALSVEHPFYFLEYAIGFCIYQQHLIKAQKECKNFDLYEYNKAFLDIGPTYFNIAMPIMDAWIQQHK